MQIVQSTLWAYERKAKQTMSLKMSFTIQYQQRKNKDTTLTQLAFSSGYTDQNHFIKEIKDFTTLTPKEFFNMRHSSLVQNHRNAIVDKFLS